LHLLAAVIERGLLAHQGLHAAHPGREFCPLDVQFDIDRKVAGVTVRAQEVGTRYLYFSHAVSKGLERNSRYGAGWPQGQATVRAELAGAGNSSRSVGQGGGARSVHGGAHSRLHGFQIETSGLAPALENDTQELIYFARDFLTDRFGRFFSWSASRSSSIGRKWQILALVSTNSRLSC
jgi:hypothetical protein